ncbi:MAG: hypothetical protein JEZ11_15995 [Desulfobacterales bacterium]|nr:hypothetical protein [Desulfobacterales bacterium]
MKAIQAQAERQLTVYQKAAESGKVTREAFDAGMVKIMIGTIKNGQLFCKKALAKKIAEEQTKFFNDGIQKAARDVTQNLTNLVKKNGFLR